MEKDLPKNWVEISFTDIFDINGGTQPPKAVFIDEPRDGYIRLLQIRDFGSKPVPTYIPDTGKLMTCKKDDILIARYGASIGRIVTGMEGSYNVALAKVSIPQNMNKNFVKWLLKSNLFQEPILSIQRTAQNGFNKTDLATISVPLPPRSEQNRIVEKLDRLFGQLELIKSSMEKIPVLLKNFRQQILTQAVTGKLTDEWREGKELEDWRETKLSIIADIIDPHPSHRTPSEVHNGIPYIGIGDIDKNGEIDFTNARKVSEKILNEHLNRYTLRDGDFIFGKIGTIGRPIIIPSIQNYTLSANVILIKPRLDVVNSKFLFYYLDSPVLLQLIKADTKSTSQPAYGIKKMREQIVPLPSTKEQKQIVSRVESLFSKADAIEEKYKNLKAKIETLPQTILHKAFKGELSEQLETDGDARDLLEEIVALKNGVKPKKVVAKKYVQPDEVLRIVAEADATEYSTPVEKTAAWYDERFELWVSQQGLAARGSLDRATLRKLFDAMDDEDK